MKTPKNQMGNLIVPFLLCAAVTVNLTEAFPAEDLRFLEQNFASPGAHQLASYLASQLRPKQYIPVLPQELPVIPYRLPLQTKRNSEVANAIMGNEEAQKMYRDGRK